MKNDHRLRRGGAALAALGALWAFGCGGEGGSVDAEEVGSAEQSVITCVSVQRGVFGSVHDTQIAFIAPDHTTGDVNYGSSIQWGAGADPIVTRKRGLLWFDLSWLPPGTTLSSAIASFQTSNLITTTTVTAHRVFGAWAENTITWNAFQASNTFGSTVEASYTSNSLPSVVTLNLTSLVQQWVDGTAANDGVLLKLTNEKLNMTFAASESNHGNRPRLEVCYLSTPAACGDGFLDVGEQCDDGNLTSGDGCSSTCMTELCTQAGCDDNNPCTADSCDLAVGCVNTPLADGTSCNDGNACTSGDVCTASVCAGQNVCKWLPTSTTNAPAGRLRNTGVWTGSQMIVWGGDPLIGSSKVNTGGIYDPQTDTWVATSTSGVPSARDGHAAVWTGSRMLIWGGYQSGGSKATTGGLLNPATNTWTATSTANVPEGRSHFAYVWTGTELIVTGGLGSVSGLLTTGGRYNPSTDTWQATSTVNAPSARYHHSAVWTGSKMIVWGGWCGGSCVLNTGALYDPATDQWTPTSTTGAPTGRSDNSAVWTGSEMIVYGANPVDPTDTGGRYNPVTDTWAPLSTAGAPPITGTGSAVWTGSTMIVWGGYDAAAQAYSAGGGAYDPATDTWTLLPTAGAPPARSQHAAVWTGTEMIIWGGLNLQNTGGRYTP